MSHFILHAIRSILEFVNKEVHESRVEARAGEIGNTSVKVTCHLGENDSDPYHEVILCVTDKELLFEFVTYPIYHLKTIPIKSFEYKSTYRMILFQTKSAITFTHDHIKLGKPSATTYWLVFKNAGDKIKFELAVDKAKDNDQ